MENVPPATRERVDETRALFCMNFYEISRHKTRDSPIGTRVHRVPVTGHKFHSLALVALEIKLDCLKKKREKEKMKKKGNKKEVLYSMSCRSYGGWFLRFWVVEEVWLEYIRVRVPTAGMKLLVLNLVFVQFRGNYREIYRNTEKFE